MKQKLKLPNLHKGLTQIENEFDISGYIFINNYHAITTNRKHVIVTDLKTLMSTKVTENTQVEYEEIMDLLEYLEGKLISASYWEELVNGDRIEVSDEDFLLLQSKGVSKELHYVAPDFEDGNSALIYYNKILHALKDYSVKEVLKVHISNIPVNFVLLINSMFGTTIKNDTLIMEHLGMDKSIRFTFDTNRHIFGLIPNSYDVNEELFVSSPLETFVKEYFNGELNINDLDVDMEIVKGDEKN